MPSLPRLADRTSDRQATIVGIGGSAGPTVSCGDGSFLLIGGPCAIEDPAQIDSAARGVSAAGGGMLRGGAYKPRTSPYDFQGLGDEGVALIAAAGRRYGLPTVVEGLAELQMPLLARSVDMIQIGARNMQNVPLLQAAAATGLPILLKRGPAGLLDELLSAAEYILVAGNVNVVLCERGIRSFDPTTRNVFDLAGALRLKELTHLPVIVDPSHATGRRSLVEPLVLAAAAAGLDGAIVEVHPNPALARSDAAQQLAIDEFARLAVRTRAVRAVVDDLRDTTDVGVRDVANCRN